MITDASTIAKEPSLWCRLLQPGRAEYAGYEWLIMRVLFVFAAWPTLNARMLQQFSSLPYPNGLAQFVDLQWMLSPDKQSLVLAVAVVHLVFYIFNVAPLWTCSVLFVIHSLLGTVVNSQGAIHHTSQIVAFVLLGQVIGYATLLLIRGRRDLAFGLTQFELIRPATRLKAAAPSSVIFISQQLIATAYVVSAISKLIRSEGQWVSTLPNIALQLQKTRMMEHYNSLAPVPELAGWAITMVSEYPTVAMVFFSVGLALELFAFVALFNRGFMVLGGLGLILMHFSISQVMNLGFFYNKWMLLIFWVNVPFWCVAAVRRWSQNKVRSLSTHSQ
ncbi:MAG: hypothetical protein ACI9R3_003862 [Verrucomicrobiales bacterium]|jgi:hypothetical protein